jgi:tetratricopeptide (TPR) repeat protein
MMPKLSVSELFDKKEYSKIIALCDEALSKNSKNANAYYNRARCYHMLGNYSNAILDYRAAITSGHSDPGKVREKLRACKIAGFNEAISTSPEASQLEQTVEPEQVVEPETWCHFFTRQAGNVAKATAVAGIQTAIVYYTMGERLGMK